MKIQSRIRAIAAAITLSTILLPGISLAQSGIRLLSADPAANSTVAAPNMIELHFSGDLTKQTSSFRLTGPDGNDIATMAMGANDTHSLATMPNATLPPGQYTVSWTVVSTDGHKTAGSYAFTVK
ncbi:MAG: copper resistance protein CopC [Steroidobacteraceae bacterium]